jgi:ring-1,2-phenylacetyl-CoA epoxidase subunit PaaD
VLREVVLDDGGRLVVSITPTYTGCPAMATMRDDLVQRLQQEGFAEVTVKLSLSPPWTSDWITERGRALLAEHGISPPGPARRGPTELALLPVRRAVRCPQCGSSDVALTSEFGSTACKAMYQCRSCLEPFDHVKEI